MLYGEGFLTSRLILHLEYHTSFTCPRLLIQYIRSHPSYLEAISPNPNQRTLPVVVTRTQ